MANTTTIHARIDTELKETAEGILAQLDITPTDAIKLLYRQIALQGGIPFELKVPAKVLAEQKLFAELEAGKKSAEQNGWMSLEESRAALGV